MSEYNDSHMLSSILERMAAQAMHLKEKIDAGLEIPSWAEYKVYSAYEGIGKALGTAYPGQSPAEEKLAAVFSTLLDKHPALKGGQSRLPDKIQGAIIRKKLQTKTAAAAATKTDQQKRRKDLKDSIIAAGSLGTSTLLVKPSAERVLGVQRYVHGTSNDAADGILWSGLSPRYGGDESGSSAAIGSKHFVDESRNKIHVATDDLIGRNFVARAHANLAEASAEARKAGKTLTPEEAERKFVEGLLANKGSVVGGAMPYEEFHSAFEQDPDHIPKFTFRSTRGIDAQDLRRDGASLGDIVKNKSKDIGKYIQNNPQRFGMGLAAGTGSLALAGIGMNSIKNIYDRHKGSKEAAATATKTDPQKWEDAKAEARAKMGGKHSARAMQLATQIYKKDGGGYSGAKPTSSNNSLKKWTKQDWNWTGGDKPGPGGRGVYLPENKADRLRETEDGKRELAAAARKKSEATRKGQQYSSHGLAANTSLRSKK
jgi:hypothetical protein